MTRNVKILTGNPVVIPLAEMTLIDEGLDEIAAKCAAFVEALGVPVGRVP